MKEGSLSCVWLMSLSAVMFKAEMPDIWAGEAIEAKCSGVEEMELQ